MTTTTTTTGIGGSSIRVRIRWSRRVSSYSLVRKIWRVLVVFLVVVVARHTEQFPRVYVEQRASERERERAIREWCQSMLIIRKPTKQSIIGRLEEIVVGTYCSIHPTFHTMNTSKKTMKSLLFFVPVTSFAPAEEKQ